MTVKRFSLVQEREVHARVSLAQDSTREPNQLSLQVCAELRQASAAVLSLESIERYLSGAIVPAELGQTGVQFANIAIESVCLQGELSADEHAFSLGAYRRDPALALEGALDFISNKLADLWALIKDKLVTFFRHLAERMNAFKQSLALLQRRVSSLQAQALGLDSASVPYQSALYPQRCFVDLVYLNTGFTASGAGVAGALDQVLQAHAQVFGTVIAKHCAWLKDNHARVAADPSAINSFSVKTQDFLMLGATPLERSIRKHAPREGSVFYRSKELPGGRAIYTEIEPKSQTGLAAIEMLSHVNIYLDKFDPVSYDLQLLALQVGGQAQAQKNAHYWSQPVAKRRGPPPTPVHPANAKIEGTGSTPRLTRELVFNTLSLDEVKTRLTEVSHTAEVLEQWYNTVFGKLWKDKDFNTLSTALLKDPDLSAEGAHLAGELAPRYLGNLVLALMNVMANATANTHTYAFTTCSSLLSYVEESLFQYTATLQEG
jgi:hypothetical protein